MSRKKNQRFEAVLLCTAILVLCAAFLLCRSDDKLSPFDWARGVECKDIDRAFIRFPGESGEVILKKEELAPFIAALNNAQPGSYGCAEKTIPADVSLFLESGTSRFILSRSGGRLFLESDAETAEHFDPPEIGAWYIEDPALLRAADALFAGRKNPPPAAADDG